MCKKIKIFIWKVVSSQLPPVPLGKSHLFPRKAFPKIHKCNPADKLQLLKWSRRNATVERKKKNQEKHIFCISLKQINARVQDMKQGLIPSTDWITESAYFMQSSIPCSRHQVRAHWSGILSSVTSCHSWEVKRILFIKQTEGGAKGRK